MCCFFFMQKTAYEMRISDWSSDVCSSDLPCRCHAAPARGHGAARAHPKAVRPTDRQEPGGQSQDRRHEGRAGGCAVAGLPGSGIPRRIADRTSVGSGTWVSVRVYIGGSRLINKKTLQT